jgi:hypothetical protein
MGFEFPIRKNQHPSEKKSILTELASKIGIKSRSLPAVTGFREKYQGLVMMRRRFGNDTMRITRKLEHFSKSKRVAQSGMVRYQFKHNRKAGVDEIRDKQGNLLATTKNFYDLTLPDGRSFDFVRISDKEWRYDRASKEVMKATVDGESSESGIKFTWMEVPSASEKEMLELMCRVYAMR